jgi:hypothetical protein
MLDGEGREGGRSQGSQVAIGGRAPVQPCLSIGDDGCSFDSLGFGSRVNRDEWL